jgi:sortase A
MNPLFTDEPNTTPSRQQDGYVLPRQERHLQPLTNSEKQSDTANPAVEMIRRKIDALYADEPDARQELAEADAAPVRSKHQQVMHDLSTSGRSLAEIQTAWHQYYAGLSDNEKHQVWQEFYVVNSQRPSAYTTYAASQTRKETNGTQPERQHHDPKVPAHHQATHKPAHRIVQVDEDDTKAVVVDHDVPPYARYTPSEKRSMAAIKKHVLHTVRNRSAAQLKAKQHLQSLLFGIGMGVLVLLVVLFGLFNNLVIAPFIRPGSGNANATPIILSTDGIAPTDQDQVIIPKINVELPYSTGASTDEASMQTALEEGAVHYPSTSEPGQKGNTAFFGHSSNNIFNKGKYKFAFVLLHELVPGDIFYLTHGGKVYTYKVYDKKIVNPDETWVLNPVQDKTATATLITCDPPGTTLHRLVVWGEQVNPDPNGNVTPITPAVDAPTSLPSDGPSLWSRIWNNITPW